MQILIGEFSMQKDASHYYVGRTIFALFGFPDDELLNMGHHLTTREFEIIKMIDAGLCSKEIADKLCISLHTVNTHRRNTLKKSNNDHISDYIYELHRQGLL